MTDAPGNPHPVLRWQAATGLVWTHYDDGDDWVVYSPASAAIHQLTASAHRLWTLVSEAQASAPDDLAARLATELALPLDDELIAATRDTLAFMDRAGLVWPVLP